MKNKLNINKENNGGEAIMKNKSIEVLTNNYLPEGNNMDIVDKAKNLVKDVKSFEEIEKKRVLEIMRFRVYRGECKGYKNGTLLVETTFLKCTNGEKLIRPYKEVKNNPKSFLDDLNDYVILINTSIESIIECIEDTYIQSMTEYKEDVFGIKAKALGFYNDIIMYKENNPEEFIYLQECEFKGNMHKGYYIDENTLVITKKFLNDKIFKQEDITGELVDISSNKKGEILEIFKEMGLIVCRYSTRKDVDVRFTTEKKGEKEYAYIFKIDKSFLSREVA
ncbi:hypothetical protein [Clostridium drakei]|uniref:Uncharacterized protein n=1 Tax=Clostridium drakei TaxID=332101 RepID=A0A2U8DVE5_9CLOT|nr:hypothetical protein [Clostridium drakei]AWI06743.1 hypothetical protein B9W14_20330 [Clostridium drakei]